MSLLTGSLYAAESRLIRKDGSVISPIPQGIKLLDGDRVITGQSPLRVEVNGQKVELVPDTRLNITSQSGSSGHNELFVRLEQGQVNSTMTPGAGTSGNSVMVITNKETLPINNSTDRVVQVKADGDLSFRSPASLDGPILSQRLDPPPPPAQLDLVRGSVAFEAPVRQPIFSTPATSANTVVPTIERQPVVTDSNIHVKVNVR